MKTVSYGKVRRKIGDTVEHLVYGVFAENIKGMKDLQGTAAFEDEVYVVCVDGEDNPRKTPWSIIKSWLQTIFAPKTHTHQASQVSFTGGRTFQELLDSGELKGDPGVPGEPGEPGAGFGGTFEIDSRGHLMLILDDGTLSVPAELPCTVIVKDGDNNVVLDTLLNIPVTQRDGISGKVRCGEFYNFSPATPSSGTLTLQIPPGYYIHDYVKSAFQVSMFSDLELLSHDDSGFVWQLDQSRDGGQFNLDFRISVSPKDLGLVKGRSAYEAAVVAGYTGTEAQFNATMRDPVTKAYVDNAIGDLSAILAEL